jgi:hypothetical protein
VKNIEECYLYYEDSIMKPSKTCENWSKIGWGKENEVKGNNLIKAQHIHARKTVVLIPPCTINGPFAQLIKLN